MNSLFSKMRNCATNSCVQKKKTMIMFTPRNRIVKWRKINKQSKKKNPTKIQMVHEGSSN